MTSKEMHAKRALLTGASGFIGSNLVRHLLSDGWDVHIIARPDSGLHLLAPAKDSITVHRHDGSTDGMLRAVRSARPSVAFHLASLFLLEHEPDDIERLVRTNLLFSIQLAEALVAERVPHLINTGTSWQHYNNERYKPVNLYAATKQAFEDVLEYYVDARGLRVATLALFDTYGPGDPRAKLIPLLWRTAFTQKPLTMSPGEQLLDLVYIDDVLRAFALCVQALQDQEPRHSRYGVSSGNPVRLVDLVRMFEGVTGISLPITWGARPYRPREVMVPWTAYDRVPHWKPKVPLEVGIAQARPA